MIHVSCNCGRTLEFPDKLGGKFARCPDCRATVAIPEAAAGDDEVEAAPDRALLEMEARPEPPPARKSSVPLTGAAAKGKKGAPVETIECPRCGGRYATDVIFCAKCAVVIATGQPVAGLVPGGASAPRVARRDHSWWLKWVGILVAILIFGVVASKALK